MILDHAISVARLKKDSDNSKKESYSLIEGLQSVKCQLQPASPEETIVVNGIFGQTYIGFTTNSGVLVGDRITVSGTGEWLTVRGVEDWSYVQGIPHYELTLVRFEEDEILA